MGIASLNPSYGLLKECYPNLPGIVVPTVNPRIKED